MASFERSIADSVGLTAGANDVSDTVARRKARGAFFTPSEICEFICRWAVRTSADRILEPSCGEAAFLLAAGRQLRALACETDCQPQLRGIEIHESSVHAASAAVASDGLRADIRVGDFFDYPASASYDVVVGNPPYVRYQNHIGAARARSLEVALAAGVRLNGLASSWAAFTVHAAHHLKRDGRLGLVLPAELLTVSYAAPVRKYLLQRFNRVKLVMFEARVFPGVLEEVILLLAEGSGGAKCFEVYQARDLSALSCVNAVSWKEHRPETGAKWTTALLTSNIISLYERLFGKDKFERLIDWGATYLGAVTGNNEFFSLSQSDAAALRLGHDELLPISPPGSRHLRGHRFTRSAWDAVARDDARCLLFYPKDKPSPSARVYITKGEAASIHKAYKCTARAPWWRVPLVEIPDLFLTYMNHDRPRLIANDAGAQILNSVYGVKLTHGRRSLGRELLPVASLNSLTLLGAEIVGRAYGGGLLKLEPREADQLPIPSKALIEATASELRTLAPQLGPALRQGDLERAVAAVDQVILAEALSVKRADLNALREAREFFFERRKSRSKIHCGENR